MNATKAVDWIAKHGKFPHGETEYASDCLRAIRKELSELLEACKMVQAYENSVYMPWTFELVLLREYVL